MSARTLFSRFETSQASYVYDTSTNAILGVPRQLWEQLGTVERDASQQPAANEAVTALRPRATCSPARSERCSSIRLRCCESASSMPYLS